MTQHIETKHTSGPWQRMLAYGAKEKRPPYSVWTIVGNTNADERKQSIVATTIIDDADARLIAAAPELLEACTVALLDESTTSTVCDVLRSAITKATQGSTL